MGRRFILLSGLAAALFACEQTISAPGACPQFCPTAEIEIIDTVLTGVVERDTSFSGYVLAHEAIALQVVSGVLESRGWIRFTPFGELVPLDTTRTGPVVERDSFRIELSLVGRSPGVSGLEITLHRLPVSVDTLASFSSLTPFFHDSTVIGVIAIADTVTSDTVSTVVPAAAFPTFVEDGRKAAVGLELRRADGAFVSVGTLESTLAASLTRFVRADSGGGTLVASSDRRGAEFDTFAHQPPPAPQAASLPVGGVPSTRAFLRVNIPSFIIDSSEIVGAEILLVPVEPAIGAVGDTIEIVANALGADFGAKSPLVVTITDSTEVTSVAVGSSDTLAIDLRDIIAQWQRRSNQPRTIVLRLRAEAASVGELRLGSSRWPGAEPALRLVFVPPFSFVER